jgi:hypothetical protein
MVTTSNELKTADNFTVSAWFKTDASDFGHHLIWQGNNLGSGWGLLTYLQEFHLSLGDYPSWNPPFQTQGNIISAFLGDIDETLDTDVLSCHKNFTDTTNYNFIAVTVSNLSTSPWMELFLNGTMVDSDEGTLARTNRSSWDVNLQLGKPGLNLVYYDGILDEVRISNIIRNNSWIETTYNTMKNPDTFIIISNEHIQS